MSFCLEPYISVRSRTQLLGAAQSWLEPHRPVRSPTNYLEQCRTALSHTNLTEAPEAFGRCLNLSGAVRKPPGPQGAGGLRPPPLGAGGGGVSGRAHIYVPNI